MSASTLSYLGRIGLWGLASAILLGGLIWLSWLAWKRATNDSSPDLRYRLACAHLAALVALPLLTVAVMHWTVICASSDILSGGAPAAITTSAGAVAVWKLAPALSLLWLTGAAAFMMMLAADLWRIARLMRSLAKDTRPPLPQLAVGGAVLALPAIYVGDVNGPMVVGLRQPLLLVPHDLSVSLRKDEQEAVLLHELAHVRRRDFGWNILQRSMLALLWFNPAAWRIYSDLAREREVCCDAWAVRHGASPSALARALVGLAERYARTGTKMAGMAMGVESRGDLGQRVRRLLDTERRGSTSPRALAIATLFSVLCLLGVCAGRLATTDGALPNFYIASAFGPTVSIEAQDPAGPFALRVRRGRVIAASVGKFHLAPGQIVQNGEHVTLVSASRDPVLALTVSPDGRIQWQSRSAGKASR